LTQNTDYLPEKYQGEIARIVEIIREEFAEVIASKDAQKKQPQHEVKGQVLRIILWGDFARADWTATSPFDILVIVNYRKLVADKYWQSCRTRLAGGAEIGRQVNVRTDNLRHVNSAIIRREPFYIHALGSGRALYRREGAAGPKRVRPLTPAQYHDFAAAHSRAYLKKAKKAIAEYDLRLQRRKYRKAAYRLNDAVRALYEAFLVTYYFYSLPDPDIHRMREMAERAYPALGDAWPRENARDIDCFDQVARCERQYVIDRNKLDWIYARTAMLQGLVEQACAEKLAEYHAQTTS
tara:strand:- start:3472 stop:4356 length:885 start_codon:yes stop_codon:yes gene_type:complete